MSANKNDISPHTMNFHASEVYFKSLAENLPHFIAIVGPEDFRIKYINKVQKGFVLENVIGQEIYYFTSPENIGLYKEKIQEVKRTGKPATIDLEITTKRYHDGIAWYRTTISIISSPENPIENLLFLFEDITAHKLKEVENINTGERIKAIINNTNDIICSIDNNYNLLEFNTTFFKTVKQGFGIDLLPGMSILDFIDPLKHEHLKAFYKRAQNGEICNDVSSFNTINGNVVYNETSYNPIYNAEKKVSGISIFSKDITERVKSEQKIKNALKEKEVLLAEIHHRIKNNLAMISSLLELQEMNISNQEAKEALAQSRKRIKSTALIHELLYRSESLHHINLKDYLTELFLLLKINDDAKLEITGDEVILDLTTAMPLGLMMNEILLNSFKHSHKDGTEGKTEITITSDANSLTIDYCDCKGIFPEHIDFKNSKTTGLTLINTFAEQLNGSIELISKTPPKYKIQIPLNENQ